MIDVLIPCYNAEEYIGKTLNSVFSQTYKEINVIAVDDGSEDETLNILKKYKNLKILQHPDKTNHGQAASLNLAISKSNSDLIAFLDADDLWAVDKLFKQVEILRNKPAVGLVYTNGYVINEKEEILYKIFNEDHLEHNKKGGILLNCYIRTPSLVMLRRNLINISGFFSEGYIASDHDMWVRAHENGVFYFLDEPLAFYRQHPNQISLKKAKNIWRNGFEILNDASSRYIYPKNVIRKRRALLHYRLGKCAIQTGNYFSGVAHFFNAFLNDPVRSYKHVKGFSFWNVK